MSPGLTIAIPLHGGRRWLDTVIANVSRAPARSTVVISDASNLDDAPALLARHFAGDGRVSVIERQQPLDWIAHANLLLAESRTEYFCWMPQDDLVLPDDYFELLAGTLDRHPDRVLAFPTVLRRVRRGRLRAREADPLPYRRPPIELGCRPPEEEAADLLRKWNMGLGCWRGVFRRDVARPIPRTDDSADLVWTFSMALAGHFIEVPEARYLKRLRRDSTHRQMRWQGREHARRLYEAEVEARLVDSPGRMATTMKQVDRHLAWHRHFRTMRSLRSAAAFVVEGRRPIFE